MLAHGTFFDLFAREMIQFVEDADGGIRYWPNFVDSGKALGWLEVFRLRATVSKILTRFNVRGVSFRSLGVPQALGLRMCLRQMVLRSQITSVIRSLISGIAYVGRG